MKKPTYIGQFFLTAALLQWMVSIAARGQEDTALRVDQDGLISIKEAVAEPKILASFEKTDRDGNGRLRKKS